MIFTEFHSNHPPVFFIYFFITNIQVHDQPPFMKSMTNIYGGKYRNSNFPTNILNLSKDIPVFFFGFGCCIFHKMKWFSEVLSTFLRQPLMNVPQNWSVTPPCSRTVERSWNESLDSTPGLHLSVCLTGALQLQATIKLTFLIQISVINTEVQYL